MTNELQPFMVSLSSIYNASVSVCFIVLLRCKLSRIAIKMLTIWKFRNEPVILLGDNMFLYKKAT